MELTDAELNRAVAERLGGNVVNDQRALTQTRFGYATLHENYMLVAGIRHRADFATSLDAMAEAEATMTPEERRHYASSIGAESGLSNVSNMTKWIDAWVFAPARTRAIAFLEATKGREHGTA